MELHRVIAHDSPRQPTEERGIDSRDRLRAERRALGVLNPPIQGIELIIHRPRREGEGREQQREEESEANEERFHAG
jgi:hypothetical protein